MYPTRARTCCGWVTGSSPSTRTDPLVGGTSPSSTFKKVDLPAPFAPTKPMMPGSTLSVRASKAVTWP